MKVQQFLLYALLAERSSNTNGIGCMSFVPEKVSHLIFTSLFYRTFRAQQAQKKSYADKIFNVCFNRLVWQGVSHAEGQAAWAMALS